MIRVKRLFYMFCITLMIFIVSLIITQRVYAITVTNPTPNPFNPNLGQTTSISFSVDNTQYVTVKIVNCRSSYWNSLNDALNGTPWKYNYTNVWGGLDSVRYGKEIIKNQLARIYAYAGQIYTVSWNGKADRGQSDTGATYKRLPGWYLLLCSNSRE